MVFCNRFGFECFVPNTLLLLKTRTDYVVDFAVLTYFTSNLDFVKPIHTKRTLFLCDYGETFTVINSVTRILLIETLYKFGTIKC